MSKPETRLEDLPMIEIYWSGHRSYFNLTAKEVEAPEAEHQHDRPSTDEDDE